MIGGFVEPEEYRFLPETYGKYLEVPDETGYKQGAGSLPSRPDANFPRSSQDMSTSAAHNQIREVMDIRQASDYLGISPDTLYKYASEAFVPAFKLGNRWRFKKSLLDEWMGRQSGQIKAVKPRQKKPVRATGRADARIAG